MIITIARECGSDGYTIGKRLSELYQIPLYDKYRMIEMAKEKGIYEHMPNFFAEKPVNSLLFAIAAGEMIDSVGSIPEKALSAIIEEPSFVVIGRCGNYVYRHKEDVCRIFLCGDRKSRVERMMDYKKISKRKAEELVDTTDQHREAFHQYYTGEDWGKAKDYDLCIDTSKLGVDNTVALIQMYVKNLRL